MRAESVALNKSCALTEKAQQILKTQRTEERAVLLCHSVNVRSVWVRGLGNGDCVSVCAFYPVIFSLYVLFVVLLDQHCDWLWAAIFMPDWLDVYTSEGG